MTVGSIIKIIASYLLITRTDLGILGAPIGTVLSYASGLIVSILIYGKTFGRIIPIFEQSLIPHLLAFTAVILSRFVYQSNLFSLSGTPSLMLSILLCALIYLGLSAFLGVIRPKRIKELAKYTNLSWKNYLLRRNKKIIIWKIPFVTWHYRLFTDIIILAEWRVINFLKGCINQWTRQIS